MGLRLGIIAAVVVAAAAVVGVAARAVWRLPPDPQTADSAALYRWLATADAAAADAAYREAVIDRVEAELQGGLTLDGGPALTRPQAACLATNAETLGRDWLRLRSREYSEVSADERHAFLESRIATIDAWANVYAEMAARDPTAASDESFFACLDRWVKSEDDPTSRKHMEHAVFDGVMHWLATRDLQTQPAELRREMADCVAAQLRADAQLQDVCGEVGSAGALRLRENCIVLLREWLTTQARLHAGLPREERTAFVDALIDDVERWNVGALLAEQESPSPAASWAQAAAQIERWIAAADPNDQDALRALHLAVQTRLFARWLRPAG